MVVVVEGAGVVGAVAAGGLAAAVAPDESKGSSAKMIGADGSGGRRGIGGTGWPSGPNVPGVNDAPGVAAGAAPGTSVPGIRNVSTVGGCDGTTSGLIDATGGVGSGSASGSMGPVGTGMANGGGSVGPVGASVIVGSGLTGSGAEAAGGGGFALRAARCPCEACRLLTMTMAVATAAASDPAMVGVSSGVGAYFGPSADIAANSAASMNRPRAKLTRTVVPGRIPATNTRIATQKATLTISVNDTIKARIDLPRTRYSQPTHLLILLDITSWARHAMNLVAWRRNPKITVG